MNKRLASAVLVISLGSCAHPVSRIPRLPNNAMALRNYMENLNTPEKLSAFNPLIEEIGGKGALDISNVHIVDRGRVRSRCGKYVAGCYWPVPMLRRIYIDRALDKNRRSRRLLDYRNPQLVEGSNLLTTYVHEQGHHMDRSISIKLEHRALDELEAMLFTLVFLQEFTKRNRNIATKYFYDELAEMLGGAKVAIRRAGGFRTYADLVKGYRNHLSGLKKDKEMHERHAPHHIGWAVFAILSRGFGYDVARMYGFIHNSPDSEVEQKIDQALAGMSRRRASLSDEIESIQKHASPLMDAKSGCTDPKILSFSCSLVNPKEVVVLNDPSRYQVASPGEDGWNLAKRMDGDQALAQKVDSLYQSADKLDQMAKRSPWTFLRLGNFVYGRNRELFAILREDYKVEIFHRRRDCQSMDLALRWGQTTMGTVIEEGKEPEEKLIRRREVILLSQNTPTRHYGKRASAQLRIGLRKNMHPHLSEPIFVNWNTVSANDWNLSYPSRAGRPGMLHVSPEHYGRLRGIAEYVAAKLMAGTAGK